MTEYVGCTGLERALQVRGELAPALRGLHRDLVVAARGEDGQSVTQIREAVVESLDRCRAPGKAAVQDDGHLSDRALVDRAQYVGESDPRRAVRAVRGDKCHATIRRISVSGEIEQREFCAAGEQFLHHLLQSVASQLCPRVLGAGEAAFQVRAAILIPL